MKALLIIDMQNACFSLTERHDREGTVRKINNASAWFRAKGWPVIFIQHDGTGENYMFPGTEDWKILPELTRDESDYCVGKTANDAFYRSGLQKLLSDLKVTTLYISGCATDFCVNATIHSALVKDYDQVIISDAHTTADRPHATALQLIDFHNWLWSNLTPTGGCIKVEKLANIMD